MTLYDKILEIFSEYYICHHCLGRMFSLLGTSTTNIERAKSLLLALTMENHAEYLSNKESQEISIKNLRLLAYKARFNPALNVLINEGLNEANIPQEEQCYLCNDIFDNLEIYAQHAIEKSRDLEFANFLVGTNLKAQMENREDIFKSQFNLLESESFKSHFNREVGKILSNLLNKPAEFSNPEITFIFSLDRESFTLDFLVRSLFIYGRYNKLIRGIPQTHWDCRACRGKGCEQCNHTGKQYLTSVEDLMSPYFMAESLATDSKFHGAGREDIDVRMLGKGRPFILELRYPKKRKLDLLKLEKLVNRKNKRKLEIHHLRFSNKTHVKKLKRDAEEARKVYNALVVSEIALKKDDFTEIYQSIKSNIENKVIQQRTPIRVSHRRADRVRKKKIYAIKGKYIKPNLFEFMIESQGGTYIKELINGDDGRTNPSLAEIFNTPLICKQLDVLDIYY